jgi:histidine triad (HIT) family protein
MNESDCIFCKIVKGEIPADIVYRDDEFIAFHDVNPQAPTHVLIIPVRHIQRVHDAKDEDASMLGRLLLIGNRVADREGIAAGYRLVLNNGEGAGQSVWHVHLHVLGGRRMGWPPG